MDRSDLFTRIESATINGTGAFLPLTKSAANDLHEKLISMIRGGARPQKSNTMGSSEARQLVIQLADVLRDHLKAASNALDELATMPLCFEYEQESASGQRGTASRQLDDIPYLYNLRLFLPLFVSLMDLPLLQQSSVVAFLDADSTVRHLEIRSQIEADVSEASQKIQQSLELAAARSNANQAYAAMLPASRNWLLEHHESVQLLGWSDFVLPAIAPGMDDEALLQASVALSRISECLVRPAGIDRRADQKFRERWFALWAACEIASEHLAVICAWLRCLGSTGKYRRCAICFRHLGDGMKKNCSLHQRTARQRVPSRELHISTLYQAAWPRTARSHRDISLLLNDASPSEQVWASMMEIAGAQGLTERVAVAAGRLSALLATLAPLIDPRLQTLVQRQFNARVAEADATVRDSGSWLREPPERAIRALTWERFFAELFVDKLTAEAATHFSAGRPLDIDHPLTTSKAVPLQKLAVDLLHMSTWTSIDLVFDEHAYLNVDSIRREIKLALDKDRERPTLQVLADIHHTSPQAIQQAMARKSSSSRGARLLARARNRLDAALHERQDARQVTPPPPD